MATIQNTIHPPTKSVEYLLSDEEKEKVINTILNDVFDEDWKNKNSKYERINIEIIVKVDYYK